MTRSLHARLDPIKEAVLSITREKGRVVAAKEFGCCRQVFKKWLIETTNDPSYGTAGLKGWSLKVRLAPVKDEVLAVVKAKGRQVAMRDYGINRLSTFSNWIYEMTGDKNFGIDKTKIRFGMTGGGKALWLRVNRDHIIWFVDQFGEKEAQREFNLSGDTLSQTLARPVMHQHRPDRTERLEIQLEIYHTDVMALRKEVAQLKMMFERFIPFVAEQITAKAIMPLLEKTISLDERFMPEEQPNQIDAIIEQMEGQRNNPHITLPEPKLDAVSLKLRKAYTSAHPYYSKEK